MKASEARTITNASVLPWFCRSAKPWSCGAPYQPWLIRPLTIAPANKWRTKLSRYCTFTPQQQRKLSSNISSFCLVWLCYNKNSVLMGSHFSGAPTTCNWQTDATVSDTAVRVDRMGNARDLFCSHRPAVDRTHCRRRCELNCVLTSYSTPTCLCKARVSDFNKCNCHA
jgi:hypothetical protein